MKKNTAISIKRERFLRGEGMIWNEFCPRIM